MLKMDVSYDRATPDIGDIIGCCDGAVGIVLKCYYDESKLMIEVAWSSGHVWTDLWNSEDFCTEDTLFHIMSRV
jgi:hypothetical protein